MGSYPLIILFTFSYPEHCVYVSTKKIKALNLLCEVGHCLLVMQRLHVHQFFSGE